VPIRLISAVGRIIKVASFNCAISILRAFRCRPVLQDRLVRRG
jgi:hypothetical protein